MMRGFQLWINLPATGRPGVLPSVTSTETEVAVLFADVRGFTQFAEAHPPEEVMRVVNAYLAALTDALNTHGGILDKYTGDGLMALFRLGKRGPDALPDAVLAALAMRDAVLRLSEDRTRGGDVRGERHLGLGQRGLVGIAQAQQVRLAQ